MPNLSSVGGLGIAPNIRAFEPSQMETALSQIATQGDPGLATAFMELQRRRGGAAHDQYIDHLKGIENLRAGALQNIARQNSQDERFKGIVELAKNEGIDPVPLLNEAGFQVSDIQRGLASIRLGGQQAAATERLGSGWRQFNEAGREPTALPSQSPIPGLRQVTPTSTVNANADSGNKQAGTVRVSGVTPGTDYADVKLSRDDFDERGQLTPQAIERINQMSRGTGGPGTFQPGGAGATPVQTPDIQKQGSVAPQFSPQHAQKLRETNRQLAATHDPAGHQQNPDGTITYYWRNKQTGKIDKMAKEKP